MQNLNFNPPANPEEWDMIQEIQFRINQKQYGNSSILDDNLLEVLKEAKYAARTSDLADILISHRKQLFTDLVNISKETEIENNKLFDDPKYQYKCSDGTLLPPLKPHIKKILQSTGFRKNIIFLDKLLKIIKHKDIDLVRTIINGFSSIGHVDTSNVWQQEIRAKRTTPHDLTAYNTKVSGYKFRTAPPKFMVESKENLLELCFQKANKLVQMGSMRRIHREKINKEPTYTFAIIQKDKARMIANQDINNALSYTTEKMRLQGTACILELVRLLTVAYGTV